MSLPYSVHAVRPLSTLTLTLSYGADVTVTVCGGSCDVHALDLLAATLDATLDVRVTLEELVEILRQRFDTDELAELL